MQAIAPDDVYGFVNKTVRLTYIDDFGIGRQVPEDLVMLHCASIGRGNEITLIFGEMTGPNTLRIGMSQVLDIVPVVSERKFWK